MANPQTPPPPDASAPGATFDPKEVAQFDRIARRWWDPAGEARPLHKLAPQRLGYLRETIVTHFDLPGTGIRTLNGIRLLDIGCGGGLVAEPLAKMGATVLGIDPSTEGIAAAQHHARETGTDVTYRACRAEDIVAEGQVFDCVTCLEVIEHVPDVPKFLAMIAPLIRPGGLLIVSTINRTLQSYAVAIVGAEYIMRWLPVGTHQWDRFVTPDECSTALMAAGFDQPKFKGLIYWPLSDQFALSDDTSVNYFAAAAKPPARPAGAPSAGARA
ncbi:MAG: hypothetical protein RL291_1298 [Pseudomonadota bacterium]